MTDAQDQRGTGPGDEDPFQLDRFVRAQDAGNVVEQALAEVRAGHKRSHWMWFVYPQIAGLGGSPMARRYAIGGLPEARAYLRHPVLGPRLLAAAQAAATTPGRSAEAVFGGIDAMKLRSSMTLFVRAAADADGPWGPEVDRAGRAVLDRFFAGEQDPATVRLLSGAG